MKLPVISGKKLTKALNKIGYKIDHQTGSHLILRLKEKPFTRVTIPNHKVIQKGTLNAILKQVDLTTIELKKLL